MLLDVVAILESRDWWQPVPHHPHLLSSSSRFVRENEAAAIDFYEACAESLLVPSLDEARRKKKPVPDGADFFRQLGSLNPYAAPKKMPDGSSLRRAKFIRTPARLGLADTMKHWRQVAQDKTEPMDWLRRQIGGRYKHGNLNRKKIVKGFPWYKTSNPRPGQVVSFFYDAKGKKTLPFWDKFPLIIFLDRQEGSFLGLNLHYLPPLLRQRFFTELKKRKSGTRMRITYGDLKQDQALRYYKPCIKRYLDDHVKSPFARVSSNYWDQVMFLPVSQFQKAGLKRVYSWSKSKI